MKIKQFFYGGDNLGYLLYSGHSAIAIDGGAVKEILTFIRENSLTLKRVTNTHGHGDHTMGTREIVEKTGAEYLDHRRFSDETVIDLDGQSVTVRLTPGHAMDAVIFVTRDFLVTGDTLFNGKVGKCFSGDLKSFYQSIQVILTYPGHLRIYAGHDYLQESMGLARRLTPGNKSIDAYAARYDKNHVFSTLADELTVNPFLRLDNQEIIDMLSARKMPATTQYQRWESLMSFIE